MAGDLSEEEARRLADQQSRHPSGGILADIEGGIGEFLLRVLGFVGLGFAGPAAAAAAELAQLQQDSFDADPAVALTAAQAAEASVKGALDPDDAAREARYSGIDRARFDAMVRLTGNPPGPQTLIDLWRRGVISEEETRAGMRQGYLKNEWITSMLVLRNDLLNVGQCVAAVVQNHLDYDTAAGIAAQQGVDAFEFRVMVDNAGNPPGPHEVLDLWNRGYIGEDEVDQALRESRLKNKWIPTLKNLARRRIPMRTITTLLGHGAIADDRARQLLRELGYSADDAQAIIDSAHHTTGQTQRDASMAQVRSMYEQRLISRGEAVADLTLLGYSDTVAGQLLDLTDQQAKLKVRNAAVGKVHSLFYAHHLDQAAARQRLLELNVPADQVDYMITVWALEEEANVHELTGIEICRAMQMGLISEQEGLDRLMRYGYSESDAVLYAMIHKGIALPDQQPTQ